MSISPCLSTAFQELTGINGTWKWPEAAQTHRYLLSWPPLRHNHLARSSRRVTTSSWQLHNSGTSTVFRNPPAFLFTGDIQLFFIPLNYLDVLLSLSFLDLIKLVLFFTWLRNFFHCLISCGAVMFTTCTPGTSPRMPLSVFLMVSKTKLILLLSKPSSKTMAIKGGYQASKRDLGTFDAHSLYETHPIYW